MRNEPSSGGDSVAVPGSLPRAQGSVGRADLLRAWVLGGEDGLAAMARLLGYEEQEQKAAQEEESIAPTTPELPAEKPFAPIPFWRLESIEEKEEEKTGQKPPPKSQEEAPSFRAAGPGRLPGLQPASPPIVADARLWPALGSRLVSPIPSRRLDVAALERQWSRGRLLRRLPFLPQAAWAPRLHVVVDRSERLIPFWQDQQTVVRGLRRRLGREGVRVTVYQPGSGRPWQDGRGGHLQPRPAPSGSQEASLVLGDLGFYGGPAERGLWRRLGRRLGRLQGRGEGPAVALVPCPAGRWEAATARPWQAVDWSHPQGAPRRGRTLDQEQLLQRSERLLGLLSSAARMEPGLLRTVRRLLPAREADLGTEADAWNHPEVASGFSLYATLATEARERLRPRFAEESDDLKTAVARALKAWRQGLPREIWWDEVSSLCASAELPPEALMPEDIEAARTFWRSVARTIDEGAEVPPKLRRAIEAFSRRSLHDRQPGQVFQDPELGPLLLKIWQAVWPGEGEPPMPAGASPDLLGDQDQPVRPWQVVQEGGTLRFRPGPATAPPLGDGPGGRFLASLASANRTVTVQTGWSRVAPPFQLAESAVLPLPAAPSLILRTDHTTATLRRHTRPPWATAMGRDRFGLWAAFTIKGVRQKMRWIPPGRFLMGSPEDEPGRWPDEGPQHPEEIRHGFWLAETPCTQELWEAVTGENPSRFPTKQRPVEQISWEDCQGFLGLLNGEIEGLEARLPLEKEWEYACRAGTETATYAGPLKDLEKGAGRVLDGIAWYSGNSREGFPLGEPGQGSRGEQQGTHPVKLKSPNSWGLYDTLGNVWEWCDDLWSRNYDSSREGSRRVLRGGSWSSLARNVRAAYRFLIPPSIRLVNLGFRLARGQGALREGQAEPAGAERQGGQRRSRPSRPKDATR